MRRQTRPFLISIFFLVGACQASDTILTPPSRPRFTTGCDETRPQQMDPSEASGDPLPGCAVDTDDYVTSNIQIGTVSYADDPSLPEFYGQTLTFEDVIGNPSSYSVCPDYIENARFTRVIAGNIETFQSVGTSFHRGPLEPGDNGLERAVYDLPSQVVYSRSGGYYTFGGSVNVVCGRANFRWSYGATYGEVDVGGFQVYGYNGEVRPTSTSFESPTAGWAYYASWSNFSNGSSDGWGAALSTFMSSGGCTPHWDVWVDGKQVCKDGQRVDQT